MSRRHDQSYKLLFSLPLALEHLVRHHIDAELADELDFDRVEHLATERAGPGLTRSLADLVCRIHFRGSSRYLLLAIEFQSAVDRYMALRALAYVVGAYRGLVASKRRRRRLGPRGLLPPVLTVTIYNGRRPWTAPDDVLDLVEPVQGELAGRQPRMRHEVLDLRELARQPPTEADVVSWMASLELDPSPGNVASVVDAVLETCPGPEHARVREAFREWVLGAAETWELDEEALERVQSLKEAEMIYVGVEEQKKQFFDDLNRRRAELDGREAELEGRRAELEGRRAELDGKRAELDGKRAELDGREAELEGRRAELDERRARVLSEGLMRGSSAVVRRQARLKFGAETAEKLSELLGGIADSDRITRIADLVIECDTGAQLLERARE